MTDLEYHGPAIAAEAIRRLREADRALEHMTNANVQEFRTADGHKIAGEDVELYRTHMLDTAGKLIEMAKLAVAAGPAYKERSNMHMDLDPWPGVLIGAGSLGPR